MVVLLCRVARRKPQKDFLLFSSLFLEAEREAKKNSALREYSWPQTCQKTLAMKFMLHGIIQIHNNRLKHLRKLCQVKLKSSGIKSSKKIYEQSESLKTSAFNFQMPTHFSAKFEIFLLLLDAFSCMFTSLAQIFHGNSPNYSRPQCCFENLISEKFPKLNVACKAEVEGWN